MAIACVACVNFTEGAHRLLGHVRHSLVVIGEGDETIDQLQRVLLSLLPRLPVAVEEQLRGGVDEPLTSKLFHLRVGSFPLQRHHHLWDHLSRLVFVALDDCVAISSALLL